MKKKMKKFLLAWAFVLCLILPTEILLAEEGSTEETVVQELNSGAIAVQFSEIKEYRDDKGTYEDKNGNSYEYFKETPDAPAGYEGWLFAGWYQNDTFSKANALSAGVTSGSAWAKFVPADILSVKAQIPAGTFYDSTDAYIRFVTSVDSLDYARVGFDFIVEGEERLGRESKTVYEFLYGVGNAGKKLNYTPDNNFHSMSKYFVIHTFSGLPNESFGHGVKVIPYWVTLDGTKVFGEQDIKSVNQGYTSWIKNVTTEKVADISHEGNYVTGRFLYSQGGCTYGDYHYQAVINTLYSSLSSADDDSNNTVTIQKYNMATGELSKSRTDLKLKHANDITYNKDLTYTGDQNQSGLLVIAHNGADKEAANTKNRISFMDPDNMEIVDPNKIQGVDWSKGSASVINETYIEMNTGVSAIDYNATTQQYVVEIANTYKFCIYDENFNQVSDQHSHSTEVTTGTYTKQGVGSDDSYIYFIYYKENKIEVFDWNGKFVTLIATDLATDGPEPENISIYNNEIYIACGNHSNKKTELYKVKPIEQPDIEAMIQDPDDSENTYSYPTLELALLEAQKGDTVTIVKENITVNSPMEVTADNVTITNKSDMNVTITRGSSLTDNVFENRANNFVIKSSGGHNLTIDGASVKGKSIICNESDASVQLDKVTIQNFQGDGSVDASALCNKGSMTLQESVFEQNSASTGGVLYAYSGTILIEDCHMTNNQSTYSGGAIRTVSYADTNLTVKNSTFDENTAKGGNGGAINFCGGDIKVIDTTFQNNQSLGGTGGGALTINENSTAVLKTTDSYTGLGFSQNSGNSGGAIYANKSVVNIEGYKFESNTAKDAGGAIYVAEASTNKVSVDNVTFEDNMASRGQAIFHMAPSFDIHNSRFETSNTDGYMIFQTQRVTLKVSDTSFSGNGKIYLGNHDAGTTELSGTIENATIVYSDEDSVSQTVTIGSENLDKASTVTLQPSSKYYKTGTSMLKIGSNANGERLANTVAVVKLAANPSGVTGDWYISDDGTMQNTPATSFKVGTNGDYATLSEALASENVISGTTLYVLNDLTVDSTLTVNKNIVLKNDPTAAPNGVKISRGTTDAMINIASGSKLSVRGKITLDGEELSGNDSLIVNNGTLTMGQNVTVQNAKASVNGGAVKTTGEMIAEGTSFINNNSSASGGAIYYLSSNEASSINGCTFSGNTAVDGGAIEISSNTSIASKIKGIVDCKFIENTASNRGGAIRGYGSPDVVLKFEDCEFDRNTGATGGVIWTNRPLEITGNGLFKNNTATNTDTTENGGAVYIAGGAVKTVNITGQTFENNSSVNVGNAICNHNGKYGATVSISNCEFISSDGAKSPIYTNGAGATTLSNVSFRGGNNEVELGLNKDLGNGGVGKVTIKGKITNAAFVYKHADALVTVASTGIDETSTLSVKPMVYEEGTQVLGCDGDSDAAKESLANAAKIIEVTQEATQSGVNWWKITSEGKLDYSAIVNSESVDADYENLAPAISDAPAGGVIYVNSSETIVNAITIDKAVTLKTSTEGVTLTRGNAAEMFNVTSEGSLTVEGDITLDGNKASINGTNSLLVNKGTLSLKKGVVVQNASSATNGGAVYSTGTLAVTDATFQDNTAKAGGAVYIAGGTASFKGTENSETAIFSRNVANGTAVNGSGDCVDGAGAIYVKCGNVLEIDGYTFVENQAQDGGAIALDRQSATEYGRIHNLKNSYFYKNKASKRGGAIYHRGYNEASLVIENCIFGGTDKNGSSLGNTAVSEGGAIWSNRHLEIKGEGMFENNQSSTNGGAIYVTSYTDVIIKAQTLKNNRASSGGALYSNNANVNVQVTDTEFVSNSVTENGGAIYTIGKLKVTDVKFQENTAKAGGAVYIDGGTASFKGTADSESAVFSSNTAVGTALSSDGSCKDGGGAIYVQQGEVSEIDGYKFVGNKAQDGGAIVINYKNGSADGRIKSLKNSYFYKNEAIRSTNEGGRGGAIYHRGLQSVTLVIEDCVFGGTDEAGNSLGNTATTYGGAIWANRPFEIKGEGTFECNSSANGGAIYATNGYTYKITGQTFNNNSATSDGGAICFNNSGITGIINDSDFVNNIATKNGGAIYNIAKVTIDAMSTFTGNQSKANSDNVTKDGATIAGLYKASGASFAFQTETESTE